MKFRACLLLIIWSILLLEPLSANFSRIKSLYSFSCAKKQKIKSSCSKPCSKQKVQKSCSKSKPECDKPKSDEEKKECENNSCNPLMSCPTGNFYVFGYSTLSIDAFIPAKQKIALINDNRILKYMAECWHPPEII